MLDVNVVNALQILLDSLLHHQSIRFLLSIVLLDNANQAGWPATPLRCDVLMLTLSGQLCCVQETSKYVYLVRARLVHRLKPHHASFTEIRVPLDRLKSEASNKLFTPGFEPENLVDGLLGGRVRTSDLAEVSSRLLKEPETVARWQDGTRPCGKHYLQLFRISAACYCL